MSALGQKQTFAVQNVMSALHSIADIGSAQAHVRFVPKADIAIQSITAVASSDFGMVRLSVLRS